MRPKIGFMPKKRLCAGVLVSDPKPRIVVAGAGAIGCFVGGLLAAAGREVTLLGRAARASEITSRGLSLSDCDGGAWHVPTPVFETEPSVLDGADVVLVSVKSGATEDMAAHIAAFAPNAIVVSLQNGVSNPERLRAVIPLADVRAAVVPFNVVETEPARFHRGTSGVLTVERGDAQLAIFDNVPGLEVAFEDDMPARQWGKLIVNLNNALNALSGLTLVEQLQQRTWRKLLAEQMGETLDVLKAAGIAPARFTALPPKLVPYVLRLPNPLFRRIAKAMLTIDPHARSSMQDDLRQGRKTEIDTLQGEVLRLAQQHGVACPVIARIAQAIRDAEKSAQGPPGLSAEDI